MSELANERPMRNWKLLIISTEDEAFLSSEKRSVLSF